MRSLAVVMLLVGCGPRIEDDVAPIPDGDGGCSDIGAFEIAAPRPGLHYTPSLEVYVDETELWAELTLEMIDNLGQSYSWTVDSTQAYPQDAGIWWNRDSFHYDLAPGQRYTLTVSHCRTRQTVTFFTSDP